MPRIKLEVTADASGLDRGFRRAGRSAERFGRSVGIGLGSLAKIGAAVVVVDKLSDAIRAGTHEYAEQQRQGAQTNAVIKSTAGIANVSAKHVDKLALSMSNLSGIDDEVIKSGENVLLTFTKIRNQVGQGNNIFDRATKAAVNWSARTGKSMTITAGLIGRALEDPAKKATSLSRAGVVFSKAQLAQMKSWQASGNVLKAQQFILGQLEKRFGGAAKAAGKTLPGQLNILKERYKDLAAQGIGLLAPAATKAISGLANMAKRLSEAQGLRAKAKIVWEGLENVGQALFNQIRNVLTKTDWGALFDEVASTWGRFQRRLGEKLAAIDWGMVGRRLSRGIIKVQQKVVEGLRSVNWSNVGRTIARGIVKFASNVDWIGLAKSIIRLLFAAFKAVWSLALGIGEELGRAILRGIGKGLDSMGRWLEKKALGIALAVLKALPNPSILGRHLIPGLNSVIGSVEDKLKDLEVQAVATKAAMDAVTAAPPGNPGVRGTAAGGRATRTPVVKVAAAPRGGPVDRGLGLSEGGTSGASAGTPKWRVAFNKLLDKLRLEFEKRQLTPSLRDDIKTAQKIVDALERQAKLHKKDSELQHELVGAEGELLRLKREQAELVKAQAQAERDNNRERREAIAQAAQQVRQEFGQLFQGPVLNPSDETNKALLGVGSLAKDLVADLKGQNRIFAAMESALATLAKRGAPEALIKELRDLGPGVLSQVEALSKATPKELRQFFAEYRRRERQVIKVATVMLTADKVVLSPARTGNPGVWGTAGTGTRATGNPGVWGSAGRFASGGGPRGSDTIPAWLSPGEVVFNRSQQGRIAGKLGVANTPSSVFAAGQRFAGGGVVDMPSGVYREGPGRYSFSGSKGAVAPMRRDIGAWLKQFYGRGMSPAAGKKYADWWGDNFGLLASEGSSARDRPSLGAGRATRSAQERRLRELYMSGGGGGGTWVDWMNSKGAKLGGYLGHQAKMFAKTMDPRPLMTAKGALAMATSVMDMYKTMLGGLPALLMDKGLRGRQGDAARYYANLLRNPLANAGVLAATLPWKMPRLAGAKNVPHVEFYTGSGHMALNEAMRAGGGLNQAQQHQYRALMAMMQPTKEAASFYRGMSWRAFSKGKPLHELIGSTITEKGFVSGSWDDYVPRDFAASARSRTGGGVVLKLEVPKGQRMAHLADQSTHEMENEWLLPPGTAYRVTKIESPSDERGLYRVYGRVVGQFSQSTPRYAGRSILANERLHDDSFYQFTAGAAPDPKRFPALAGAYGQLSKADQRKFDRAFRQSDRRIARALGLKPGGGPLGSFFDSRMFGGGRSQQGTSFSVQAASVQHSNIRPSQQRLRLNALAAAMGMLRMQSSVSYGRPSASMYAFQSAALKTKTPARLAKALDKYFGPGEASLVPTMVPGVHRVVDSKGTLFSSTNNRIFSFLNDNPGVASYYGMGSRGWEAGGAFNSRSPSVRGLTGEEVSWDQALAALPKRQQKVLQDVIKQEQARLARVRAEFGIVPGGKAAQAAHKAALAATRIQWGPLSPKARMDLIDKHLGSGSGLKSWEAGEGWPENGRTMAQGALQAGGDHVYALAWRKGKLAGAAAIRQIDIRNEGNYDNAFYVPYLGARSGAGLAIIRAILRHAASENAGIKLGLLLEPMQKLAAKAGAEQSGYITPEQVKALVKGGVSRGMEIETEAPYFNRGGVVPGMSVPMLAQGGIAVKPTLALIGEKGPEAVVPLGAGGFGGGIVIEELNIYESSNPEATARAVREELGRIARTGVSQRGGRYAGRA